MKKRYKLTVRIYFIIFIFIAVFCLYFFLMTNEKKPIYSEEQVVQTAPESMGKGKNLFDAKCKFCHSAFSTETLVGPGLKGILRRNKLPASSRPATVENIIRQFKKPFSRMPSFEYLTDEEIADLIAFLNTL